MSPLVNLGQVEERTFDPLPAGTYEARMTGQELKDSQSSEYQYHSIEFTIDEGEYADRKLWDNYSLNPKSLFAMKRTLVALGAPQDDLSEDSEKESEELWEDRIGEPCRLVVKQRTYTDPDTGEKKLQNDITKVLPPAFRV